MNFRVFAYVLAATLPFVHGKTPQSGTKACSADVPGLCTQDFEVIDSTFGIILPPQSSKRSSLYENDFIHKIVQPVSYGSAGIVSSQADGVLSPGSFVVAQYSTRLIEQARNIKARVSVATSPMIAQLLVNGTSAQGPSGFALQPPPAGTAIPCTVRASPVYSYTKQQITAYARLQGCQIIKTTSPTTVNFFETDAAPIHTDSNVQSAIFPIDGTFKTGSVVIENLDKIRTSTESYKAALSALQLD